MRANVGALSLGLRVRGVQRPLLQAGLVIADNVLAVNRDEGLQSFGVDPCAQEVNAPIDEDGLSPLGMLELDSGFGLQKIEIDGIRRRHPVNGLLLVDFQDHDRLSRAIGNVGELPRLRRLEAATGNGDGHIDRL